jgi:pimeloyl-ACP methyl ester carboxylesterase
VSGPASPARDMRRRIRRACTLAIVVGFFVTLAGMTYQGVATALERRRIPHPGRLVDVGGHQLHIHCTGDGAPTVILEADAGLPSAAWGAVQPRAAQLARVCSYDRAGLGWSETGEREFDAARVAQELHALLGNAAERPPFIIVGAGTAAAFSTMFAAAYPGQTAALVLVNASADERRQPRITTAAPWLARLGVRRIMRSGDAATEGLPDTSGDAVRAFLYRPDHLTRAAMEVAREVETMRQAADARPTAPRFEANSEPDAIVNAIRRAIASTRR